MSPSGKPEDLLTIDWEKTQSTGGYSDDNETNYEWEDTLCILLDSGNFVSIQTFFRMRVGTCYWQRKIVGTMWCKIFEWESDDYKYVMDNDYIMDRLENNITPNPPYISEMKTNYRELQIDKIL
jgi:hypothetical protein